MKKSLVISGILAISLLPLVSLADVSASTSAEVNVQVKTRAELEARKREEQDKREENKDTIKATIDAKKEAVKTAVEERRQNVEKQVIDRLKKFVANLVNRFEAAVERLNTLSTRIESRIAKLEAAGIDVTESKTLLVAAKLKIQVASSSIAQIQTKADAVITGDTRALYPELKSTVEQEKALIKEAQAALVEVVKSLKPGQLKLDAKLKTKGEGKVSTTTATTTATTTDNN